MSLAPELTVQTCPLCGETSHHEIKRHPDGVVVGRCVRCGLLYTPLRHARPEDLLAQANLEELKLLYGPITAARVRHFRHRNFQGYLEILSRHTQGRRLLDVGCAHGFFLDVARRAGFEVTGIEPSPGMGAFAREVLGLRVLQGRLDQIELAAETWDAISFTDSLEYLPDPTRDLGRIVSHLSPGGVLLLKAPNADVFRLRHALEHVGLPTGAGAFTPSRRVVHYTLDQLRRLVSVVGLEVVEAGSLAGVDSPVWFPLVGLWLEVESPWYLGWRHKWLRRVLHALGRAESGLFGRDHLSQAIYVVASKRSGAHPQG